MKKVFKNLPNHANVARFERKLGVTVTYVDCKTGEIHFIDNDTGKKWRSMKSLNELICAVLDNVELFQISAEERKMCFLPEDYNA